MKVLLISVLALSLGLNIFLWRELARQRTELETAQASASEGDQLRQQIEELKSQRTASSDTNSDVIQLARLRNEVGQLRQQRAAEVAASRAPAAEAAELRARLAVATHNLARSQNDVVQAMKLSPEELEQAKVEAQSIACVNNMKQIGLAARLWANDHNDVFPPDFFSMKEELNSPKILFCPGDPTAVRVNEWSQLNAALISYRFLNPNGNETEPSKALSICPIHGHVGLSDGSAAEAVRGGGRWDGGTVGGDGIDTSSNLLPRAEKDPTVGERPRDWR
jgi:hypothetical protein